MRSSTSFCLIAASSSRIARGARPRVARIAAFMSSVIRSFRLIAVLRKAIGDVGSQTKKPAASASGLSGTAWRLDRAPAADQYSFFGSIWLRMRL